MSEDNNQPTRPTKEKVKDELTSNDDNNTFDRGDAAGQEQKRILREAKVKDEKTSNDDNKPFDRGVAAGQEQKRIFREAKE